MTEMAVVVLDQGKGLLGEAYDLKVGDEWATSAAMGCVGVTGAVV